MKIEYGHKIIVTEKGRRLVLPCRSHKTTITKLIVYHPNIEAIYFPNPEIEKRLGFVRFRSRIL